MLRNEKTLILATLSAFLLAGCEGATAPSGSAEVEVTMEGGAGGGSATNGAAMAMASAEGTVEVRTRVYLQSTTGQWVEVTRGVVSNRVEIDGSDGAQLIATTRVAAESYNRVRVEFERVTARLEGSSWVALGLWGSEVRVGGASGGRVVVERPVIVRAEAEGRARVHIALNAAAWIAAADETTGVVQESTFAGLLRVTAR